MLNRIYVSFGTLKCAASVVSGAEYELSYSIVLYVPLQVIVIPMFSPTMGLAVEDAPDIDKCIVGRSLMFKSVVAAGMLTFLVYFATLCELHRLCRSDISIFGKSKEQTLGDPFPWPRVESVACPTEPIASRCK